MLGIEIVSNQIFCNVNIRHHIFWISGTFKYLITKRNILVLRKIIDMERHYSDTVHKFRSVQLIFWLHSYCFRPTIAFKVSKTKFMKVNDLHFEPTILLKEWINFLGSEITLNWFCRVYLIWKMRAFSWFQIYSKCYSLIWHWYPYLLVIIFIKIFLTFISV